MKEAARKCNRRVNGREASMAGNIGCGFKSATAKIFEENDDSGAKAKEAICASKLCRDNMRQAMRM